jgi:hypothetical protein
MIPTQAAHPIVPLAVTAISSAVFSVYWGGYTWMLAPIVGKLTGDWDASFSWTALDAVYWVALYLVAFTTNLLIAHAQ